MNERAPPSSPPRLSAPLIPPAWHRVPGGKGGELDANSVTGATVSRKGRTIWGTRFTETLETRVLLALIHLSFGSEDRKRSRCHEPLSCRDEAGGHGCILGGRPVAVLLQVRVCFPGRGSWRSKWQPGGLDA